MRPGPRRAWAMAKPAFSSPRRFATGMRTSVNSTSEWPSGAWWCRIGTSRTTRKPGAPLGTMTKECLACLGAAGSGFVTPITRQNPHFGCKAPVLNHLRPLTTYSSPSRRIVHCRLVGSLEATSGSVIPTDERMVPSISGVRYRSRWSGVANRCSTSMLPVSGAEQLNTSEAQGSRPITSASGA